VCIRRRWVVTYIWGPLVSGMIGKKTTQSSCTS
jgi:hypothetical protein